MSQIARPKAPTARPPAGPPKPDLTAPPPAWRALVVGLIGIPIGSFCAVYGYTIIQAVHWSQQSLKLGPIFLLFLIVALNGVVKAGARRYALTQGELVLIYSMLLVSTAVGGIGMVQFHIAGLAAPYYFASGSNGWEKMHEFIPWFFAPTNPDVIGAFYRGNSSIYRWEMLSAWIVPVLFWSGFLLVLVWVMLCMNTLIRKQWVDSERLTFPLVFLPLEMTRGGGEASFWKNRLMWGGFLLAGTLESINSLNWIYPAIPKLAIKPIRLESLFTTSPWNGMGMVAVAFYPFMIGIAFLLTLDVSFSCWFFYLVHKLQRVFATAIGWSEGGGAYAAVGQPPYIQEQAAGAFVGLAIFALWTARRHLAEAARAALESGRRAPDEIMSYRSAYLGILAGLATVTVVFAWLGLPWWITLGLFGLYFMFQLTITRIVVESGAGWHFAPAFNPQSILFAGMGEHGFSQRQLTMLSYLSWANQDFRDSPMPHQLEAMKMAQSSGTHMRRVFWALMLAALVGALCAYWAELHIYYRYGAATANTRQWITNVGKQPFQQWTAWVNSPQLPEWTGIKAGGVGMVVVSLLAMARQRFVWWPFHPIGYAVAHTNSLEYMWMPFFIAWTLKALVLRYGGMRMYRAVLPFFLGLILGDYIVPALWFVYGWATGARMYMSFPH